MSDMKTKAFIARYIEIAKEKGVVVTTEEVKQFIDLFYDTLKESLIKYPGVNVDPIGLFSVTALSDRVRVLRGNVYQSKSKYKVRYYIPNSFHEELCKAYDGFEDDVL